MAKYDMTIIGGGSGGLIAARTAAALGASVLLIDKEELGGDCLHYGCVPSKSMIHFSHVAAYQAGVAVRNALVPFAKKKVDYRVVPWCTFTDPEAARVGLTPQEAEKKYKQVRIVKFPWANIDRAQTEGETIGFIKLVLAGKKDEIVGAHMVGARSGEMLGEMALAMRHNLTLNDILGTIHAYPTMNTGIQQAVFEAYLEGEALAVNRKIVRTVLSVRG